MIISKQNWQRQAEHSVEKGVNEITAAPQEVDFGEKKLPKVKKTKNESQEKKKAERKNKKKARRH